MPGPGTPYVMGVAKKRKKRKKTVVTGAEKRVGKTIVLQQIQYFKKNYFFMVKYMYHKICHSNHFFRNPIHCHELYSQHSATITSISKAFSLPHTETLK